MASIALRNSRCIDYLAYVSIFTRATFRPKIKLDVFFSARKAADECWEVVVGVTVFTGEVWGYNICHGDEEISKLQKTIPRNFKLPATLCRSVA